LVIVNKTDKPAILTESDQILNDLKTELATLKSRMNVIEEEQEQNRSVMERLSFQEDLANEMIINHQNEILINRENYQIIANSMHDLKSPVSEVVSNLSGIIAEIDDEKTQNTLKECMNTASNVLESFGDVEDFCLIASSGFSAAQRVVNSREFFRDLISGLQSSCGTDQNTFRLLVDKHVPEKVVLHCDTLKSCFKNLIQEIQHSIKSKQTTIFLSSEKKEQKYGIEIEDLSIKIEADNTSSFLWSDSWLDSINNNKVVLLNSGFNLLKTRDLIRKTGGYLKVLNKEDRVSGFEIQIPLSY